MLDSNIVTPESVSVTFPPTLNARPIASNGLEKVVLITEFPPETLYFVETVFFEL